MIVHDAANRVVHLRIGSNDCALRMPRLNDAHLQVDRYSERAAIQAATEAGLAPEVLACDPLSGVLVTRWIEEPVWTPEQARQTDSIQRIAELLRRLHSLPVPRGVRALDLAALIDGYWRALEARQTSLPADFTAHHPTAQQLLQRRAAPAAQLCHNDLHAGNIVGTGPHVRLLDWEYAGIGEPLFDLASYTQANDLTAEQRQLLLEAYGAPEKQQLFAVECWLFDWVCVLWLAASGLSSTPAGIQRFNRLLLRLAA